MDFYKDDGEADASGKAIQAKVDPFPPLVGGVLVGFGGEPFCATDDEGADEAAVDDAGGLAENHFKLGILLVHDIDVADRLLLRKQGLDGLFVAVQRDAEDGGVPLLAQVGGHLGNDEGFAHLISGGDALYAAFFEARDLIKDFCHVESFFGKFNRTFGRNLAEATRRLFFFVRDTSDWQKPYSAYTSSSPVGAGFHW